MDHLPAIGSNECQPSSAEALAGRKWEYLKVPKGPPDELEAVVSDHHSLEPKLLHLRTRLRKGLHPRSSSASPVARHKIEIRKVGFSFDGHRPNFRETLQHRRRRDGVAVTDKDPTPAASLDPVPPAAHQRDRVPIRVGFNKTKHVLPYLVREHRLRHPSPKTSLFLSFLCLRSTHSLKSSFFQFYTGFWVGRWEQIRSGSNRGAGGGNRDTWTEEDKNRWMGRPRRPYQERDQADLQSSDGNPFDDTR